MDDSLNTAKARIRAAFESGIRMTTAQGNRIGKTVDFRKIVSLLKKRGIRHTKLLERKGRAALENLLPPIPAAAERDTHE